MARSMIRYVIGPDGRRLTLADLPSPGTKRWVIRRKAEVVAAVRGGLLTLEEACDRYTLNYEEFLSWQHRVDDFGLAGLRTTRTQFYSGKKADPDFRLPVSKTRAARIEALEAEIVALEEALASAKVYAEPAASGSGQNGQTKHERDCWPTAVLVSNS